MMNKINKEKLYIKKLENFPKNLNKVNYETENSSGIDLVAAVEESIFLKPGERALVPTGISIAFDEKDLEAQIRSRSGLAYKNGVVVFNSPGTIDNDYRGEIKVILANFSKEDFEIKPCMRIAQMVISRYIKADLHYIDEFTLNQDTERGSGGFGSTGEFGSTCSNKKE